MAPRGSIVWGAKDIANTGGALVSLFGEREELRKEVSRLRHHVSQLAKKLHRKEKELEEEKGKGRGLVIEVKSAGGERVEFPGREEGARAPVEEEVAEVVVRLPSVASSVAVSEVAEEEMGVADVEVAEVVVPEVAEVAVLVQGLDEVVVEEGTRKIMVVEGKVSVPVPVSIQEVDMDEDACGGDGTETVGVSYPRLRRLSEVGEWSRRAIVDRVGMDMEGTGDVEQEGEKRLLSLAPKGPSGGWVPAVRGKKRKVVPGEWGLNAGGLAVGRSIPTGPRLRAVPVRFGTGQFSGGSLPPGVPKGPRRLGF